MGSGPKAKNAERGVVKNLSQIAESRFSQEVHAIHAKKAKEIADLVFQ